MAVVEDPAAAEAVAGEPAGAAPVPVDAVLVDLGDAGAAESALVAVGGSCRAGWAPAVVGDPVGDRVLRYFRSVVGLTQAPGDFCGEATLPVRVAGREAPPVQGADECGECDGFGVADLDHRTSSPAPR